MMKILNVLKEVKDNRNKSGRRYPLHSLLALTLLSRLCGYTTLKGVWHFARSLHYKQLHQLGFRNHYKPSYPTILKALDYADVDSLESSLSKLVGDSMEDNKEDGKLIQLRMDGKRLRGRKTENDSAYHLLSLFSAEVQGVYGQIRSNVGGGEICAAMKLLSKLDITDKVITGDAMFSSERLCKKIVKEGGDYAFTLKSNRQELYHEVLQVFRTNPWPEMERKYKQDICKDHGRIEQREIKVMNWPYSHHKNGFDTIKQVAQITRYREVMGSKKKENVSKAYIITSLNESKAGPKELLELNRQHWDIENKLHRTRDTLFDEDKQTIRTRFAPQANSALSNTALWIINKNKNLKIFKDMSLEAITQACARNIKIPLQMLL